MSRASGGMDIPDADADEDVETAGAPSAFSFPDLAGTGTESGGGWEGGGTALGCSEAMGGGLRCRMARIYFAVLTELREIRRGRPCRGGNVGGRRGMLELCRLLVC